MAVVLVWVDGRSVSVTVVSGQVVMIRAPVCFPGVTDAVPDGNGSAGCAGQEGRQGQKDPEVQAGTH
jgi:hypothetical protein